MDDGIASANSVGSTIEATCATMGGRASGRRVSVGAWVGAGLVGLVCLAALSSFVWTPQDPLFTDTAVRLQAPSSSHWLGTDRLGRDVLSNIMAGTRITLLVGLIVVAVGAGLGVPLGMLAATHGGRLGETLGRGFDLLLAFPGLLLAIIFAAAFGASSLAAALALGIGAVPGFARVARAASLQALTQGYIKAARVSGRSGWQIAFQHVLPNIASNVLVQASVAFGLAVLAEAGLSYLGLGTPPPTPSWGRMLQDGQAFLGTHLYLVLAPGSAIAVAVLGFNLLGDGLRDLLDPRLRDRDG